MKNLLCKECVLPNLKGHSYWPTLPLRLMLGIIFILHGYPKLFGDPTMGGGIDAFAGFLATKGILLPMVSAWIVALLEFFGGILMVVGVAVPLLSALFIIEFIVATWVKMYKWNPPLDFIGGYEFDLLILAAVATLAWFSWKEACAHHK